MPWHAACSRLPRRVGLVAVLTIPVLLPAAPAPASAQSAMFDNFARTSPKVGEMALDFTLLTLDNEPFHLLEGVAEKPVVLEFGSFT